MKKATSALSIISTLPRLSDFDLDAIRKAVTEEGERRGRAWALKPNAGFGRRQAG